MAKSWLWPPAMAGTMAPSGMAQHTTKQNNTYPLSYKTLKKQYIRVDDN